MDTLSITCFAETKNQAATVDALAHGLFGNLAWVETRMLSEGSQAFADLDKGAISAAKLVFTL